MICCFYIRLIAGVSLWLLSIVLILSLAGCLTIDRQDKVRQADWEIDADCEEETVKVRMKIDRSEDIDAHSITK
mgnify:CR=1 FL=1